MRYVLKIAYDGTGYAGWQRQKNALSVQEALEDGMRRALGADCRVTASGRTDAGVHAAGQVCNFALADAIKISPERVADALNAFLPPDVRVLESAAVPESFDACRSAKKKTYRYTLYFSRREHPLLERRAVRFGYAADLAAMRACAALVEGEHDFAAFSSTGSSVKTTVRTVYSASLSPWEEFGVRGVRLDVCGSGFLYNMVRIIAGAVAGAGAGMLPLSAVQEALRTGERDLLGKTMPAKGLTLLSVEYAFPLFGGHTV